MGLRAQGGAVGARGARRARARGISQDVGLARHAHQRAHRAALDIPGSARGGAGAGPQAGARRRALAAALREAGRRTAARRSFATPQELSKRYAFPIGSASGRSTTGTSVTFITASPQLEAWLRRR